MILDIIFPNLKCTGSPVVYPPVSILSGIQCRDSFILSLPVLAPESGLIQSLLVYESVYN